MNPLSESDTVSFISVSYFLVMLTTHRDYYKIWRMDNFETEVVSVRSLG